MADHGHHHHEEIELPREVKMHILRNYTTPSNIFGCVYAFSPVILTLLLFMLARSLSAWHAFWLVPVIGWAYYRIYFPLHDSCHYTLFKNKKFNIVMGYVMAAILATPYKSFRKEHLVHHTHYSTEEDPGAVDYFVHFNSRREMLVFFLTPLWGGTLLTKVRDYYRQIFRTNAEASRSEKARTKPDYYGYLTVIIVQFLIMVFLTRLDIYQLWRYPLFALVPGATVFLFLSRLRMFLEHGSLDYEVFDYFKSPRRTSRDFFGNLFEGLLLSGAGFKYHYEHHLLPNIPSHHLKTVHENHVKPFIHEEDTRDSYGSAIYELWRNVHDKPESLQK